MTEGQCSRTAPWDPNLRCIRFGKHSLHVYEPMATERPEPAMGTLMICICGATFTWGQACPGCDRTTAKRTAV